MANIFITSDQHYGHANCLNFTQNDGSPFRPFESVEEMDETIIQNHNSVVKQSDKCYFLGDVVMNTKQLDRVIPRLNGDIVLIKGNHCVGKLSKFTAHFRDIRAYHVMDKILLAHIPVHPESLSRWRGQCHGHLHHNIVHTNGTVDDRYLNVCVEKTNYTPISFEECRDYFNKLNQD